VADLKYLILSWHKVSGFSNDHDYICKCRPADVLLALDRIKLLEAENERLTKQLAERENQ